MDTYKSELVTIDCNIDQIYAKLANPESFKPLLDRLPDEAKSKLEKATFDKDSITIEANPVGEVKLNIVERVEPSRVVFAAAQSPVPLQVVFNLTKVDDYKTSACVELGAELNPFIRPMLSKPLQDAANKFGEILTRLPFNLM